MDVGVITKKEIQRELIEFLCRQFLVEPDDIDVSKSLVDTGIIDSMGLIEIASYISNHYGFKVEEEHMNRDNFGSVLKIVDFIEKMKIK
jgi:acyl carrier protein